MSGASRGVQPRLYFGFGKGEELALHELSGYFALYNSWKEVFLPVYAAGLSRRMDPDRAMLVHDPQSTTHDVSVELCKMVDIHR